MSNIIRQKMIVAIDSAKSLLNVEKTGLLFLPEGEYHELGLLFVYYMLKSRGAKVLYLGANVPIDDIQYVIRELKPDFLFTHLTSVSHGFNFDRFINNAVKKFENVPFLISGRLANTYEKKIPNSIQFKRSLHEVTEFIGSLS
jgi:hypothetical protein